MLYNSNWKFLNLLMPQLSPMNWAFLYLIFSTVYFSLMSKIHFKQ